MTRSEWLAYHEQEAVRYRSAAASATTPATKALLKKKAEEHEKLIEELDGVEAEAPLLAS